MASLTIKSLPDGLLERLRERAASESRSLDREVIRLLEQALRVPIGAGRAARQVEAWRALAGRWSSDRSVDEEVAEILDARRDERDARE